MVGTTESELGPPTGPLEPGELGLACRVARRLAAEAGVHCALVGGSLAAGLGNSASDIDIFLAGPDLAAGRQRLLAGGRWFDVHRYGFGELAALIRRVVTADPGAESIVGPVSEADLSVAIRLSDARSVVTDEELDGLLGTLDRSRLAKLVIRRWNATAFNALEDLSGQRDAGDADAAVLCARSALLAAGKGVAAACGDLHDGLKWVYRQLERAAPADFPLAYFRTLTRCDPLSAGRCLRELEWLTQTFMIATAVLGLHSVPIDRWPTWVPGDGPLRRAGGFYPSSAGEHLKITKPGVRLLRMRWDIALVWGLADGTDEAELIARADQLKGCAPAYRDLTAARCRAAIGELAIAGLLTPRAA
jgi:hypothetical protein